VLHTETDKDTHADNRSTVKLTMQHVHAHTQQSMLNTNFIVRL